MWTVEQFGAAHEGYVGAVLEDGGEPEPAYLDPGSGSAFHKTREWWAYSGSLNRPRAARARAACSCGWRGDGEYVISWEDVDIFTDAFPSAEPLGDWHRHIADVEVRTVPLPAAVAALLEQLDAQLTRLAEDAPLAALKAVAALESTTKRIAGSAAAYAEADDLSGEVLGRALGVSPSDAESRLLRYRLTR
ncbi:hypothetical protein GKQ77_17465 [Streptomyces sp. BG9H]|uniref:Uncharacterized protein n=1 Tax=Streptomyces anatolicus TaxID=2675858 RepID=A0ABS6YPH6_9ACTN|nr:hypothetical protein [Streptomyces anatolicus]MBW5423332.1 hypothetical protein [Streptomyces anatolicus]